MREVEKDITRHGKCTGDDNRGNVRCRRVVVIVVGEVEGVVEGRGRMEEKGRTIGRVPGVNRTASRKAKLAIRRCSRQSIEWL